ncbi:hypothetical protein [Blastomonas sp.]|uniref:hypothetical protein n=1 Tax=Blastomonas sp. TaxID=1909299 RepID=UPI00391CDBDB
MISRLGSGGGALVALTLAGVVAATLIINQPIRFPLDDAYITIANAQQIVTGAVDSYGYSRPSGATSPVHMLLLVPLGLVMDWPAASLCLAMLATLAYVGGLYQLLLTVSSHRGIAVLGSIAGFMGIKLWYQLMNGLETGLAMAAVTWTVYLAQFPDNPGRRRWLAGLIGVLPFIRPELALLSVVMAIAAMVRLYSQPAQLLRLAALTLGVAALLALLAWLATGELIPQTAGAKVAFFGDGGLSLRDRLLIVFLSVATAPLGWVLLGLAALPLIRDGWALLAFVAVYLLASAASLPSGLMHNEQRYLFICVPLALAGWAALGARADMMRGRAAIVVSVGAALMIASFFLGGWTFYRDSLKVTADQEQLVIWSRGNLPRDARVLIHDAGYFGWKTDFALVDLVGLKSPDSVVAHRRWTMPSAGRDRNRAVAEIASRAKVSHAIILDRPFWRDIAGHLRKAGWRLEPLRAGPNAAYHVYRLTPPGEPSPTPEAM